MKILQISPYCPYPPSFGGALRIYNLLKQMLRHNEVTLVFPGWEEDAENLRTHFKGRLRVIRVDRNLARVFRRTSQIVSLFTSKSFTYRLGRIRELQSALDREFDANDYNLVQTEFPHMATYRLPSGVVRILDSHNIEYDNFRRIWEKTSAVMRRVHYYDEYRKIYREELDAFRRQDIVMFTSERDRAIVANEIPDTRQVIIPNGVDSEYYHPSGGEREKFSIVFTGVMKYVPNHDGVVFFLDNVFPLIERKIPGVKFYVVGNAPPDHIVNRQRDNVIVTGFVPDVRPYMDRSTVSVIPLRMGSGTRLKLVEAFSMRLPVVSTSIGAEGIDVVDGESVLLADEPEAFADAVVRLLRDAELRARLVRNGYQVMSEKYEWKVIGDRLERVYESVDAGAGVSINV